MLPSRFVPARAGRVRRPSAPPSPRSRSAGQQRPGGVEDRPRSAASSSRPGSSSRVAPSPSRIPCRVAIPRRRSLRSGSVETMWSPARVSPVQAGSRRRARRRQNPAGRAAARARPGTPVAVRAAVADRRLPTGPGPIAVGTGGGDPGELSVAPASSCWMATRGSPLAWRRLTATSWSRCRGPYRAVLPGRPDGRSGPMVVYQRMARRSGTAPDPAARLAVVVDGQRRVDPLGELVKGPALILHGLW